MRERNIMLTSEGQHGDGTCGRKACLPDWAAEWRAVIPLLVLPLIGNPADSSRVQNLKF